MVENKMKIEIWSDIMCPFCYIGKRHFEAALSHFEHEHELEIEWKSFQLDPTIPEDVKVKTDIYNYIATKKGLTIEEVKTMHNNVIEIANNAGLSFNFDNLIVANSLRAHRIIQLAKTKNLGDFAEEIFFSAYFIQGEDLGNEATLYELASKIGLDKTDIDDALTKDDYLKFAKEDITEAQELGIDSVPFFVLNRKYAVKGAQPAHHFLDAIKQAHNDWKANTNTQFTTLGDGESCDTNGNNC